MEARQARRTLSAATLLLLLGSLQTVFSMTGAASSSASFFGDSYIRMPLDDANSNTDIKLQFKTHQSQGLLFLAAGRTDYCVIELKSGMIHIRMDLGSGEAAMHSPPGLRFDDLAWHYLHLTRIDEDVTVIIDNIYTSTATMPGNFYELNINHGILVGGMGTFTEVFLGNFRTFRGCMRYVLFNDMDVFYQAQQAGNPINVYRITWECSTEFDALSNQPISFISDTSFVAFPHLRAREVGKLSFELKTRTETGLLLFNSGRSTVSDFFAAELSDGKLKLFVDKGSGTVELDMDEVLNDGLWHHIDIEISEFSIDAVIDGNGKSVRSNFGDNKFLDLIGHLFVGGVGMKSRIHANQKKLASLAGDRADKGSIQGCIRNFKMNNKDLGIREVQVTHGISPQCIWGFHCAKSPCIEGATCTELSFNEFTCDCGSSTCKKEPLATQASPTQVPSNIITVQEVIVQEGSQSLITNNHIDFLVDYTEYNVRESSIVFTITSAPAHGQIYVDVYRRPSSDVFTMLDVSGEKVSYIHDGSESTMDTIGLELEFLGTNLPSQLRHKYGFIVPIRILPGNDKPTITLPQGGIFTVVQNTRQLIGPHLLDANDLDDSPRELIYTVRYEDNVEAGFFELTSNPRTPISTFTQEDVNDGRVGYVHRGVASTMIKVRVSDGEEHSDIYTLRIEAVAIELRLMANSGSVLHHSASVIIFPDNLTVATNALAQDLDIRYEITELPKHGELQRQRYADNEWVTVTTFAQRHIDKSRLRYLHTGTNRNRHDSFNFQASCLGATPIEGIFQIEFADVTIRQVRNRELILNGTKEIPLSGDHIKFNTNVPEHRSKDIKYSVISPPRHGHLLKVRERKGGDSLYSKARLGIRSNFSQADINNKFIVYVLHRALYSTIVDNFQFRIFAPGGAASRVYTFEMKYIPQQTDVKFVNNGLQDVLEGGQKPITKEDLYMETMKVKQFSFTLISLPEHGTLQKINPSTERVLSSNVTRFTNADIAAGSIVYKHDDSESIHDEFNFMATPIMSESEVMVSEISEFTGTFQISVRLKNDNQPVREVDQTFHVVSGGGRLLTGNDLRYSDPDIDFDDEDLQYTRRGIPNGELVYASNHSAKVYKFTQKDLNNGRLYLMHQGASYGRAVIWVTDGQFYKTGLLEIQAENPYIRLVNDTGLSVQKGQRVVISTFNLSIETNIDARDDQILFIMLLSPNVGAIVLNGKAKTEFTYGDIKSGRLKYEHDNSESFHDTFQFAVKIFDTEIDAEVLVRVYLESHQHPPKVVNNKRLIVDEGRSATIERSILKVVHPDTQFDEIRFTIKMQPVYGILKLRTQGRNQEVHGFTQADINHGRLMYVHKEMNQNSDMFVFDVTNGIMTLQGLEFVIEIIPRIIPLEVKNMTVQEGGTKAITPDVLQSPNKHFQDEKLVYVIIKQPHSGWIETTENAGAELQEFNSNQVKNEFIYYAHDGNDTMEDSFTFIAKSRKSPKQSNPYTCHVNVLPVNDQPPRIITNKELQVWTGSVTPITPDYLKVRDSDTDPAHLKYQLTTPSNGYLALTNNTGKSVTNFTQELINKGWIVYVHEGDATGGFRFQVNDGINYDTRHIFTVVARPLVLNLTTNTLLEVYPGTTQPISNKHLMAVTNDHNQSRPIIYTLQTKPRYGKLVTTANNASVEITSFTQRELDEGVIGYHHTEGLDSWRTGDSFMFEVSTSYSPSVKFQTFRVDISYDNVNEENKKQLISVSRVAVEEGSEVLISKAHLDVTKLKERLEESGIRNPRVKYEIVSPPKHGDLILNEKNVSRGTTFRQSDVNTGNLYYVHDHSDTAWDSFKFRIQIGHSRNTEDERMSSSKLSNTFNITVIPINDEPFTLLSANPGVEVVQGFSVNITKTELLTEDPDSEAEEITYNIINGPKNGHVALNSDPKMTITSFTQKDINDNMVLFVPDGTNHSGMFYFKVSDGQFQPIYKVFKVRVVPLSLEVVNNTQILLLQSRSSVYLNYSHLSSTTNGHRSNIRYNVTLTPKYGSLFMYDQPVVHFSQEDIDKEAVVYIQTDVESGFDHFEFSVYYNSIALKGQRMNITVMPYVLQKPFRVPAGSKVPLTVNVLNATALATATNTNPLYEITMHPKYGRLTRGARRGRRQDYSSQSQPQVQGVSWFTHEDIINQEISYEAVKMNVTGRLLDHFEYVLKAQNVQPAHGKFTITLKPMDTRRGPKNKGRNKTTRQPYQPPNVATAKPEETEKSSESEEDISPHISDNHLLVVLLVSGITIIVVVILILIKCRKKKKPPPPEKSLPQKVPLSQPHIHIEPHHYHHRDEHDSMMMMDPARGIPVTHLPPITHDFSRSPPRSPEIPRTEFSRTVPCKVTPLGEGAVDETELKASLDSMRGLGPPPPHHPGDSVGFDWDTIDPELLQHCRTTNPVLHKNKYWV